MIASPVNGFVGKRLPRSGRVASSPNAPVVSVVDITRVRMVANLVEKDVKRDPRRHARARWRSTPSRASSSRDASSRIAPVFDPATRTAEMEIEVPNPGFRLKPGMYARVQLTVDTGRTR